MASEIHNEIFKLIEKLNNAKTYSNYEFIKNLTRLNKISRDREMHSEVCQHLNTLNFPDLAIKILRHLEYENKEYENFENWTLYSEITSLILNTSDNDAILCFKYMEVGIVKFLKDCCCFLVALPEKNERVIGILSISIGILSNISRFFPLKENLGGNVDWLKPLLEIKEGDINISSMILLSNLVGANENEALLDDEGNIGCMFDYLKGASFDENHRHEGYSLEELLFTFRNLTKSAFNRKQLMKYRLLDVLIPLLENNDENIQELTMNIILTMLLDDNILPRLPSGNLDNLREILTRLRDTENLYLSNNISSALQRISP